MDRVLGGGLVSGSLVLLGGDPGIGKSTLLLQLMGTFAQNALKAVYITGEESLQQVSLRAQRMHISAPHLLVLAETSIDAIVGKLHDIHPDVVVVDSIQTMFCEGLESTPGSVGQVRESASVLLQFAKQNGCAIILVGHVTKDGAIAGPRLLEHLVDTVLYFEGESHYQYRIVRAVKNRFGPSGEIAIFAMSDIGLQEVVNPSELFLHNRSIPQVGTAITPVLEGTRVLVVELQSLVNKSHFGLPQRVASGIAPKKLSLLIAVLERYGGIMMGDHDIFFNIAGGLSVSEPAIDLGICAAVLSSFRNRPLELGTAFIGEIGLGGEVRPVNNMLARIRECAHLGIKRCIVPKPQKKADWTAAPEGTVLVMCKNIADLANLIL